MEKLDRLKELEKVAELLGIGKDKEVQCIGCKLKIKFTDAIILTNKKKVKYLCKKCNEKLEQGKLEKENPNFSDILKELDKLDKKKVPGTTTVPYNPPVPYNPNDWKPLTPDWTPKYTDPYEIGDNWTTYTVSHIDTLFRLEPNYGNKTNASTK